MQSDIEQLSTIALMCQRSAVGKLLPNAFYVHLSALSYLEPEIQSYENLARLAAPPVKEATLVKISTTQAKVSYLFYPDFDTEPHPALQASIQVDLQSFQVSSRDYSASDNSPILHPKETFVAPDYPLYEQFAQLTRTEVALGFLEHPRSIGTRREWLQRLENHGVEFRGHHLIKRDVGGEGEQGSRGAEERGSRGENKSTYFLRTWAPPHLGTYTTCNLQLATNSPPIERHKAAIVRNHLSRPVFLALEAGVFDSEREEAPLRPYFFDYGCGHGGDVQRLAQRGYTSSGWDPYYYPDAPRTAAEIVNLGYVINVIEDPTERCEALLQAWALTGKVLIVAAHTILRFMCNNKKKAKIASVSR